MAQYVGRRAVVRGRGHPDLRATHGKTLELTAAPEVTARATCVVGVAAHLDPDELAMPRGRVAVTLAAGGLAAAGEAVVNPDHDARERAVVRRSGERDPDTLLLHSSLTARDLDAALVAALADPRTEVVLTVTELDRPRPLVLLGRPGVVPAGRLGRLWRGADAAVDAAGNAAGPGKPPGGHLDRLADGILDAVLDAGGVVAVRLDGPVEAVGPAAGWLAAAAGRGARFAVLPDPSPAGPLPALLAAGLPAAPALWLGTLGRRDLRRAELADLLRAPPVPTVLRVPPADAAAVLGPIAAASPEAVVAVEEDPLDVGVGLARLPAAGCVAAVERFPGEAAYVVLPAAAAAGVRVALPPVARALVAAGVPARTVSEALRPLGLDRRTLYRALDDGRGDGPGDVHDGPGAAAGRPMEPPLR